MAITKLPTFDRLMTPLLRALGTLGGSGSIEEIYDKVVEQEHLSDDVLTIAHDPERSTQTEVGYRLAWARTYLRKYGLLENSSRGVWALTQAGNAVADLDPQEVVRAVRAQLKKPRDAAPTLPVEANQEPPIEMEDQWKEKLYALMTDPAKVSPAAFERLVQRLLRESGFSQVEVTGRTGDGGSTVAASRGSTDC